MIRIVLGVTSNSSLVIWVAIELNILSFLPLICIRMSSSLEIGLKYFLVQRWGSILFLFLSLYGINPSLREVIIIFMIILKLGAAPLHGWFVSILIGTGTKLYIILATVQKVIPLIITRTLYITKKIIIVFILFNVLVIAINLSTIGLIKILAYSRVNSVSWIILRVYRSHGLFIFFFSIYLIILLGLGISLRSPGDILSVSIYRIPHLDKVFLVFIFLSLGGMPPFLGFIAKLAVIKFIVLWVNIIIILFILFGSFMMLYLYLRYSYMGLAFYGYSQFSKYSCYNMELKLVYFTLMWFTMIIIITKI